MVWSQGVRLPWQRIPQAVHWRDIGSFEKVHRPSLRRQVRRFREASDIHRADLRVFNSTAMLEAAAKAHPRIARLENVIVPNGLRLEPFLDAGGQSKDGDGTLKILLPQSDNPHKQNELAAEVICRVSRRLPSRFARVRLIVPGAGEYLGLKRVLAHHGLTGALDLRGHVTRHGMAELYAEAHLVLVTSRGESFCNPAIEAAAAGRWLVAAPLPVLRETGGPMSWIASSDDPQTLADGVLRVAELGQDEALRQQARAHAKGFAAATSAAALRSELEQLVRRQLIGSI